MFVNDGSKNPHSTISSSCFGAGSPFLLRKKVYRRAAVDEGSKGGG
jgi:hypothetical protein